MTATLKVAIRSLVKHKNKSDYLAYQGKHELILILRIFALDRAQGLLVRDTEHSYLTNTDEDDPMQQLHGASVTYRIAVGPRKGRKVFTL